MKSDAGVFHASNMYFGVRFDLSIRFEREV